MSCKLLFYLYVTDREKELALKIILQTVTAEDFKEFSTHYKVLKIALEELNSILPAFNIDSIVNTYNATIYYLVPGNKAAFLKVIEIVTDMAEIDYTVSFPK